MKEVKTVLLTTFLVTVLLLTACSKAASNPETTPTVTKAPSVAPLDPTTETSTEPSVEPTATVAPTQEPGEVPTLEPTMEPTMEPTEEPVAEAPIEPTVEPTVEPTPEVRITVINVAAPSEIFEGNSFNIKADISVDIGNITKVRGRICDSSGNVLQEALDEPNSDGYSLAQSNIDSNLKFGKLTVGEYLYEIAVWVENKDEEEMVISESFSVVKPVVTGITASVSSKTRYIGDSLTASDFTVKAVMSDGSKKKVSGWTAEPLTLGSTNNTITICYQNFATTVTVTASEKVAVVTPEPTPSPQPGTNHNLPAGMTMEEAAGNVANYAQGMGWQFIEEDYHPGGRMVTLTKNGYVLLYTVCSDMSSKLIIYIDPSPDDLVNKRNLSLDEIFGYINTYS